MKKAGLNLMSLLVSVIIAGVFNTYLIAQSVPMGINYQAVARDANGDELINRSIDVRLSIISGSPEGEVELEEVHSEVITSQFGLFNIIIGKGIYSNGTVTGFEDIPWEDDLHFLKVEIKFDNEYLTMGTMQFLSVPYALYAQKSLEPGPQGPPGPAGDPATDDQVLSYDPQSHILSLENDDNPVDLSGLINDADADPDNELQILNLTGNKLQIKTLSDSTLINSVDIDASPVNEIQNLSIQGHQLSLSLGNSVSLPDSVNDDDADPLNEIQDLSLTQNILSIENGNSVTLNYDDISSTNELQVLSISNDTIYLSNGGYVKLPQDNVNDGDIDPANEIQDLILSDNLLTIENGNTVALNYNDTSATNELITGGALNGTDLEITDAGGTTTVSLSSLENIPLVGFRAKKTITVPLPNLTDTTFLFNDVVDYNDGGCYNPLTGIFTTPSDGVYTFRVNYIADGSAQKLYIYMDEVLYEILDDEIASADMVLSTILMKLVSGQTVRIVLYSGIPTSSGTGSFTGFRIH